MWIVCSPCHMDLFIGPKRHQPLDPDGTIPSNHLHSFEHSNISLTFFIYALLFIILAKIQPPAQYGLSQMLGAVSFGQQFLLFNLHSADHTGLEGQYHWLLQLVILVSFLTTLLCIVYPRYFLNGFIRSLRIFFQGVWFMAMGIMLWTPECIPKGCYLKWEDGHEVVRCRDHEALERPKSLVNIFCSWYLVGVTVIGMCLYLGLYKMFPENDEQQSLTKSEDEEQEPMLDNEDIEAQKRTTLEGKQFVV